MTTRTNACKIQNVRQLSMVCFRKYVAVINISFSMDNFKIWPVGFIVAKLSYADIVSKEAQ